MFKKKKKLSTKSLNCLNCGHPFTGHELFCPSCGQKNSGKKITFGHFIKDVFAGFFSWDAKFWRTLFPLLVKPGKVSRDYIEGKRARYTNPFRFYLTTTIIFFLLYGIHDKYSTINNTDGKGSEQIARDSIQKDFLKGFEVGYTGKMDEEPVDSLKQNKENNSTVVLGKDFVFDKFIKYNKENPEHSVNQALENLNYENTFWNRFRFDRAQLINSFREDNKKGKQFLNKMLSYGSISLFILLPLFAIFLKLFYIRHPYTYVEHLIFVFHTQTVFFIMLTLVFLINVFLNVSAVGWFTLLFLIYLFVSMKRFYQQKNFKTFLKFCLLNFTYIMLSAIGVIFVALLSFALF